jgi:hypothetical protein
MSIDEIRDLIQRKDGELSAYIETNERSFEVEDPVLRAEALDHLIVTLMESHRLRMECLRRTDCQETFRLMNDRYLELRERYDKIDKASGSAKKREDAKARASELRSLGMELVEFSKDTNLVATAAMEFLQKGMD